MNKSLTVLMPVYNGGAFLEASIQSILDQTFEDFELLIIDDASKDDSVQTISSFKDARIRFVKNEKNLGLIGTLNKGLELASADIIARMDQDDIAEPDRLVKQLLYFENDKDLDGMGTATMLINTLDERVGYQPVVESSDALRRIVSVLNPFAHPTMMFRKRAALAVGGYSNEAYAAEDYDLWEKMIRKGKMTNHPEALLRYRLTPSGMSLSLRSSQKATTTKITARAWGSFGKEGPAPLKDWAIIWPKRRLANLSGEEVLMYSTLHLLFAKSYRSRGMWWLAYRHLYAAWVWKPASRGVYLALLMFVLPYSLYSRLEEMVTVKFMNARAGV